MNGSTECPSIYIPLGTPWNVLFLNLMNWLPELKGMEITDQDSVVIQYRKVNGWAPLAGDEQLSEVLNEFNSSGSDLYIRCAPDSEFMSGSDEGEDDGISIIKSYKQGFGGPGGFNKGGKKSIGPVITGATHKKHITGDNMVKTQ